MRIHITSDEHIQLLKQAPMYAAIETTIGKPIYLINPTEEVLALLEKLRTDTEEAG